VISLNQLQAWEKSFTEPDGNAWKGAFEDQKRNRAFQNTRNLLRSIYFGLIAQPEEFPDREPLIRLFLNTLSGLKPY
jgi:hypothetical protein